VIPLIILAVVICVFFLFLAFEVWRYSQPRAQAAQLAPIDLDAFTTLTDPEEERFLRANLSQGEFRVVQRLRIRAVKAYVSAFSQNASTLIAAGQSARYHSDADVAAAGMEILQRATRLKIWCLFSLVRLNTALAFPTLFPPATEIANPYRVVTGMAMRLPGRAVA
jgi:hypothetical protein